MFIRTAKDAADVLAPLFGRLEGEKVVVLHLDIDRRLIATTEGEAGGEDEIELPVRGIIADALRFGSMGLIVAHNHPSGDPTPSGADMDATRILATTADNLGIELHDHLIMGKDGDCRSLKALGLL
ncbi:MAG TPA: JAB domain-containing protein [Allosphingosinicella sp.]|uniref:JAB domain-containing protein n=1 Tax=Allosphingosinicella sp. TaxID=2823234 RepID=UPI002ED86644